MAQRRINKELKSLIDECPIGYNARLERSDWFHWKAAIQGPDGSDYEGGIFYLEVHLSHDYPFKPPRVHFTTRILHPNVTTDGLLSLDYAKEWTPAWTVSKLLLTIGVMLSEPNPHDPLNVDLSDLYFNDRQAYHEKVRKHTKEHAIQGGHDHSLITQRMPPRLCTLTGLCRITIRNRLRENNPAKISHNIKLLPLPTRIKDFLLMIYLL